MQIVIDIPDEKYQGIINRAEEILDESTFCSPRYLYKAVLNGTLLSKGHGRLKDENEIKQMIEDANVKNESSKIFAENIIKFAPTIIEADTKNEG